MRELAVSEVAWCQIKCKSITETRAVPFDSTTEAIKGIGRSFSNMKLCIDMYHHERSTMPDENG